MQSTVCVLFQGNIASHSEEGDFFRMRTLNVMIKGSIFKQFFF